MMAAYAWPIAFALLIWWFSTGAIIFLDNLPQRTFRWSMLGATILLGVALVGLARTSGQTTLRAAYLAFTCGMVAWGWQEISFYMGFVTGPRRAPCPEGCRGWKHFLHAIQTSLWHELSIIVAGAAVVSITWGQPNQIGTWTFMILWWMHQSAKLNVFLGVRNLNEEFLPEHLNFLKSFFSRKPMNLLFPVSVTVSTVLDVRLYQTATSVHATPFEAVGYTFLGTLMALAVLEHWFLVVPLPAAKLWHWGLASRSTAERFDVEVVAGFLGAGKTTVLRRMLREADGAGRTVVLVNDFAAMGVDGALLDGAGAEVVELANGCICCSLRSDLTSQLREAVARWQPRRVLVEPSGVADVAALLGVLARPELKPMVRRLTVHGVIDAAAFLADHARMPRHFEAQARLATSVLLNKSELVSGAELRMIATTLRRINPALVLQAASYGVPVAAVGLADLPRPAPETAPHQHEEHGHEEHGHEEHEHGHAHAHDAAVPGLTSWSTLLTGDCDAAGIEDVLQAVARGEFGAVERVKGIARVRAGWVHFDMAGGRSSMAAFIPRGPEQGRVVAIGRGVDALSLNAAFAACAAAA